MEAQALNLISEGVLNIQVTPSGINLLYHNNTSRSILGPQLVTEDWLLIFEEPNRVTKLFEQCLSEKRELSICLRKAKTQTILQATLHPFGENQVIAIIKSPISEFSNLQQLFMNIEGLSCALMEYDTTKKDFRYMAIANHCLKKMNKDLSQVIGKMAVEDGILLPEVANAIIERASKMKNIHERVSVELTLHQPTFPEKRVMEITVVLMDNCTEKPVFFMFANDLTELRELEDKLMEKKMELIKTDEVYRLLRTMFELSEVPMGTATLVSDSDLRLKLWNSGNFNRFNIEILAAKAQVSLPEGIDLRQVNLWEVLPKEMLQMWVDNFNKCKSLGAPVRFESEGKEGRVYDRCVFQVGENMFSYFSLDITKKKALEKELIAHKELLEQRVKERTKELENALQVKERFLATMSHELRTPIAGISGAVQLLKETSVSEDQNEILEVADTSTQQLLTVINDILDLSKLEANKVEFEENEINFNELVENSIELVGFEAEKKNLDILLDIKTFVPPFILGDQIRIRQILINLLNNAVKFSYRGSIIVGVSSFVLEDGRYEIKFSIQDEGIGISKESQIRLFEPFTQADSSTNRKFGGTGLGLSICKRLCEKMGGRIWIESEISKGTSVYFTIVVKKVEKVENPTFSEVNKLLLVSNNEAFLKILSTHLQKNRFEISTISSLEEGSLLLKKDKFDIAMIDGNLNPNRQLVLEWLVNIPVAVLGFSSQLEEWKEVPRVLRIRKPIRPKKIINALQPPKRISIKPIKRKRNSMRILVAEDNKMNQTIATKMLKSFGFDDIEVVENGKLAVEAAKTGSFDIILMDIMMPEMGGIEATQLIRKLTIRQPVIIAVTADVFIQTSAYDFDDFVLKPIDKSKFNLLMEKYTNLKEVSPL